jgi:hypothetical protein
MEPFLPSHPETYSQLIKRSIHLYRASFSKVILLSFLLALVVFVPRFLSLLIGQDIFLNLPPLSPHRFWLAAINIVGLLFFIAILWHTHCVVRGIHEPLIEDVGKGVKKIILVLFATLLQSLIVYAVAAIIYGLQLLLFQYHLLFGKNLVSILLTCFVFMGQFVLILYISTLFLFLVPLIAIENHGILKSLERSVLLVWNHWWRTFSVQFTPWICYLLFLFFIKYILHINIHIYFLEHGVHPLWTTLLNMIIFALFIPWVAAILLVQLKDLELRKKRHI